VAIDALFGRGELWYPGLVVGVDVDEAGRAAYDLVYDDGDEEAEVGAEWIRLQEREGPGSEE
jgi:hypothetical protein